MFKKPRSLNWFKIYGYEEIVTKTWAFVDGPPPRSDGSRSYFGGFGGWEIDIKQARQLHKWLGKAIAWYEQKQKEQTDG
jgi:hypothetical protein